MPHLSGIDFLKSIKNPPMVIFTTAYAEFAVEGFEFSAVDYLLKPIAYERFLKAVNKAYELYSLKNKKITGVDILTESFTDFILVKVDYSTVKININDILYIEGLKDYVKIYCGSRPILTKSTMKNIGEKLSGKNFLRVHKSYIVSISRIDSIENQRIIIGDKRIPVGEQYKDEFNRALNDYKL